MILEQFKLDGKVAIVTGASKGLGQAMAIRALRIRWPGEGEPQVLTGLPMDCVIRVTEGSPDWGS